MFHAVIARTALALGALALAAGRASLPPPEAINEFAPNGKMRAAINLGNPILAGKDPASGELRGKWPPACANSSRWTPGACRARACSRGASW